MVLIGIIGTIWGLLRTIAETPARLPLLALAAILGTALIAAGLQIRSTRLFLLFLTASWLISRGSIVLLFPKFVLVGDEAYFHDFVRNLLHAIVHGPISALSNSYDFPVWLARSFPFYLPLAALFGPNDVLAARWLNVFLGAGQLLCVFFVARRLIGGRSARLCGLLLLLFPYHLINVLSYDPQIAGTFFLIAAVLLFLRLTSRSRHSPRSLAALGFGLALCLLGAGIQRGGIDFLLIAVMLLVLLSQAVTRNTLACLAAVCVIWLPLRLGFGQWVASQDANLLRTHTLGFMTRGWNLDTAGEYLPLYEQLDITAAQPEKQRTLEAVLITEFAREPIRSLLVLAPVKTAKFFALGYASTAEQGLAAAGYPTATWMYQQARAFYAPVILILCWLGLLRCWQSPTLQRRLMLPVLLTVLSSAAIVLIWETSPRYSHPIQFALLILSSAGVSAFSRSPVTWTPRPGLIREFASSSAAIALCWLLVSLGVVGVARSATNYQFLDPRALTVQLRSKRLSVEPLHPFTTSWEAAIRLPAGTPLPATMQVSLPAPATTGWDHLSVSLWLPDSQAGTVHVSCRTGLTTVPIPAATTGHIARVQVPRTGPGSGLLTISITAPAAQPQTSPGLRLGIGYALVN